MDDREVAVTQREVASLWVKTARKVGGWSFDYSEASVTLLDEVIDDLWDPDRRPGEEELDSLTKLMGAYLGEVMIRNQGGRWSWSPDRQMPALLVGQTRWAYVLDKVYKRQVHGAEHSLVQFYEFYRSRWVPGT